MYVPGGKNMMAGVVVWLSHPNPHRPPSAVALLIAYVSSGIGSKRTGSVNVSADGVVSRLKSKSQLQNGSKKARKRELE